MTAIPLTAARSIVVISDKVAPSGWPAGDVPPAWWDSASPGVLANDVRVEGGYLERLPLALIASGAFDAVEIWHHCAHPNEAGAVRESAVLTRRVFPFDGPEAPFRSGAMVRFLAEHGAPHLLLVYGLGVGRDVLEACGNSAVVYNSIDAPTLRVPPDHSALFDLVLTGAQWQSEEVERVHPGKATAILPVGPEFAAPEQFRPLDEPKPFSCIYVGAAQPYKRHDILFDALEQLGPGYSALCVFGYGELAEHYRDEAARRGLDVTCILPPGLPYPEVNRLMNSAQVGIVAGVDDGAPAILTEYMLAGLPVLANAELCCGRQYIRPETGMLAPAEQFADTLRDMLSRLGDFTPRAAVLANWTWPQSTPHFLSALAGATATKELVPC